MRRTEDDRREELAAAFAATLPHEIEKVTWPLERLWALRDERLRELIRHAKRHSPWHAKRLEHLDPARISADDLSIIPVMTKADLMENWDEIVTDRRLTLERTSAHLERIVAEGKPGFLLDDYVALATGGSSGYRAVIVWQAERFMEACTRPVAQAAWRAQARGKSVGKPVQATVMASSPLHGSAIVRWIITGDLAALHVFPPALPLADIVCGLNGVQPTALSIYPSMLALLAAEARAGRLGIRPDSIICGGEPLLPEVRRASLAAFGVEPVNGYGTTEIGLFAGSNPPLPGLHLAEDLGVYEPVDRELEPVPAGVRSASLLVTSVLNLTLPIIRYLVTDEVTFLAEPNPGPWAGRRIADVEGRLDEVFTYPNGVAVHPHVIRSILTRASAVVEYQIRQTGFGIDALLRANGDIDCSALAAELTAGLRRVGLPDPRVEIAVVNRLERHAQSGKLKRFIPLMS